MECTFEFADGKTYRRGIVRYFKELYRISYGRPQGIGQAATGNSRGLSDFNMVGTLERKAAGLSEELGIVPIENNGQGF